MTPNIPVKDYEKFLYSVLYSWNTITAIKKWKGVEHKIKYPCNCSHYFPKNWILINVEYRIC